MSIVTQNIGRETNHLSDEPDIDSVEKLFFKRPDAFIGLVGREMKERILIVDDDPIILEIAKSQLEDKFEVQTAPSGYEGMKCLCRRPCAAVVSDLFMPGIDGIELLRNVKDVSPRTVRVAMTASPDFGRLVETVNQGEIFRILPKPFNPKAIQRAIDQAVEKYRASLRSIDGFKQAVKDRLFPSKRNPFDFDYQTIDEAIRFF